MNKKTLLLGCLLVGLLSITYATPCAANGKPSYALSEDAFPGWYLHKENGSVWEYRSQNLSVWWQIWIDAATWGAADKAMVIILSDFGIDFTKEICPKTPFSRMVTCFVPWETTVDDLAPGSATAVSGTGLDECVMWNDTGVWYALGCKGSILVMANGVGSDQPPSSWFPTLSKTIDEENVTQQDLIDLLTIQAGDLPSGIPGFGITLTFVGTALLFSVIFILRKDQLSLLSAK